ncbi:hypothetical protein BpHYR1_023520 [Brachionus plicatilis]|uniref:Uncharacterized protein n=1 Tax=Brachionus plicatilis TaxID=10195 RepID=A0A3M7P6P0_BRAPC|nr:hypothetical protein BpHYR1_023520 [Brachionus plicatilis]
MKTKRASAISKKALVYQPKDIIITSTPATNKPTAKPTRKQNRMKLLKILMKSVKIRGRGRPRKN